MTGYLKSHEMKKMLDVLIANEVRLTGKMSNFENNIDSYESTPLNQLTTAEKLADTQYVIQHILRIRNNYLYLIYFIS